MRIAKLKVQDFRIIEETEVVFDQPLSVIKAGNHQGKSTLNQAIQLSLTSQTDGTDPRGAGALDKVRLGAKKALIETTIEGKQGLVTLAAQYGPGKTGRTSRITTEPANEKITTGFGKYLDANQERLCACLNSNYFVSQKPEQQKAILATLVLPTSYEFNPEMVATATKHLGAFLWADSPVKVIDQVYEAAYGARRTAKAALAAIRVPSKPMEPKYTAEVVQDELGKLRAAAAKESKAISGGGTVQIGRIEQSLESERQKLSTAEAELTKVEALRDELDTKVLTGDKLKDMERLAAGRKLFNQFEVKIATFDAEIKAQREAQAIYEELLQDDAGNPVDHANCPTCTQAITRKFIDGKIAEHKELEGEAAAARASLRNEQADLGSIQGAEKQLEQNEQFIREANAIGRTIKQVHLEIETAQTAITKLTSDLAYAKANEQAPADSTKLDSLNAEIAQWEAQLSPAVNYNAILEQIKTLTAQWVAQKDVVDDLEVLCTHFGKDGIKAQLIAEHIAEFTTTINSVLAAWGYSAKLEIEPYEFIVTTAMGNTLPLKELSGSEKLMFSVALQTAIAVHGKIKMVVVDEGDTFVGAERGRLLGCLKKLLDARTLDQALVFASEIDKTKINKAGVATFWIEAGKVEAL
jgi:hypothetical protein